MVAAVSLFAHRSAAELAAPDHQRFVEQPALLQITQQAGDRLIRPAAQLRVIRFDPFVSVPLAAAAGIQLHEADAPLDQPPRQQAHAAERLGLFLVDAVQRLRVGGLLRQIDRFRSGRLHPKRQLVCLNASIQFRLLRPTGSMCSVELREEIELAALLVRVHPLGVVEIRDRRLAALQPHSLIDRRHESRSPIARPVDDFVLAVLQHDERRHVLVLGAEPVADPRPQRRPPGDRHAGVHLADAPRMIDAVRPTRPHHRDVVHALGRVRQPITDPQPALAVLSPLPLRRKQRSIHLPHRQNHRLETRRQLLPRQLVELRFWIERVDRTRTTFHKEKYDRLCPPKPMRHLRRMSRRRRAFNFGDARRLQQPRQGDRAEASTSAKQYFTAS